MALVEFKDGGGAVMKLQDFDGRYRVPFMKRGDFSRLKEVETRYSDVFICAYPKSGCHWVWEIASMLKKGDAMPLTEIMEHHVLDFGSVTKRDIPSPRVLLTHSYFDRIPDGVRKKNCKIIYLLRDPKDVCVSYFHHLLEAKSLGYDGRFNNFIQLFLEGKVPFNDWTRHILNWSQFIHDNPNQPVHVIHYEDLKQFPEREIRRLADYLNVEANDSLIMDIETNTRFATMKTKKESLHNPFKKLYKGGKEIMYRKGEVGDWRNWFSDEGHQLFDNYITEKLGSSNFGILKSAKRYLLKPRL